MCRDTSPEAKVQKGVFGVKGVAFVVPEAGSWLETW